MSANANNPLSPTGTGTAYPSGGAGGYGPIGAGEVDDLGRPYAPYMADATDRSQTPPSPMRGGPGAYGTYHIGGPGLPRTSSVPTINMRAPFLSPASRPGSSLWAPPSYPYGYAPASGSSTALNNYAGAGSFGGGSGYLYPGQYPSYQDIQSQLRKSKPIMPSSRITQKLTVEDKPWLATRSRRERVGYWLTIMGMIIGCGVAGVLIWYNYTGQFYLTDSQLCSVLSEDWSGGLDLSSTWVADNELGGFDHGEFQATTQLSQNLYVSDNELYIMPTLTSDYIDSTSKIFDGYTFKVPDCSTTNTTACEVSSSNSTGAVVNPVMSARISTQGKYSIQYGRVEVVAKIPSGDWLWPAIWMLPVNNTYGAWPMSGEIDIMMARGNPSSYPAQGVDYVRGQLIYGVMASLQTTLYGWWDSKMTPYSEGFHTYSLEWTADWMRIYVDSRLHAMVESKIQGRGGKSFFDRGDYPTTTQNGSSEVVVENIWEQAGGGPNAPFDQEFYLILDVAAGGTNGWFPDSEGDKPWYDGSDTAMREFAEAQSTWAASWPSDAADRAFRVSSVKMWKLC
ncbi:glycoside hydrolase family 16 protein [Laetiporus sulphureus 93-53]|uniref:Glycoside hydrolase family 16 protein n=1 Tax=Laetiporus sulphureus 93-53 TaxID=1314785 RepID=A0A165ECR1_9APHY|nr:glycoside hydrolase family 16 protein [Laetiporus sulphureus 93-53]KZT06745.1 glycoside hydrolase family 16 protein [Laetiporus sulphureus 93-53]